ncbi:MAG: preprotein translocase subunit SecG [Acholeplasmataceae bacterium]|jgi:preprotein translocase subunit SecG|nr:preprotein translocase subunit SecG [Acholeplasmataceae bacterium]MCK9234070.1 preprotein translocase subunit SecG [Acholeplasmataceae bacterium]MCK9288752.1 preprotein translocase subunit SecG [Acholeplasmataceae bacterium]MCK9427342.1 preprotein translocase subunit SecG [Acholeplasmataceae bacterium]MDD4090348.1 preprotein translocase subunit SecG [Acholeplasmataceae bacterium]
MIWVDYLILVVVILLILTVAIQEAQDNISDAFSGEKSDLFKQQKTRGFELFLMRSTFVFAFLFIGLIFLSLALH